MHNGHIVGTSAKNRKQIFILLVLFRWLSLIPPLAGMFLVPLQDGEQMRVLMALVSAILINIVISFFATPLNYSLKQRPWILGFDLLFVAVLLALAGGWRSPYYLYILSPILAAAFFFQIRGALIAVTLFLPLYFGAIIFDIEFLGRTNPEWLVVILFTIGSYLIGITVGYVSHLLAQLQSTQDTLYRRHQELMVLHDFGNSPQLSTSFDNVEEQALLAITKDLDFQRAIVGLIDHKAGIISRCRKKT